MLMAGCENSTFQNSVPAYPVHVVIDTRMGDFVHFQPLRSEKSVQTLSHRRLIRRLSRVRRRIRHQFRNSSSPTRDSPRDTASSKRQRQRNGQTGYFPKEMITLQDVISIGIIRRTHYKDLPPFVFVLRDGLLVPFRSENISDLIGEEGFVLRSDVNDEEEGLLTWQDLVGYTVVDEGQEIGIIETVDESTINTLATLTNGRMLPLHEDFITKIDEDAQILRVRLPFAL